MTTTTKTKPKAPPMVPADAMPAWSSGWSLGLPVGVSHAGDAMDAAVAAGADIPAPIAEAVRVAAHVAAWQHDAQRIGADAESQWRADAMTAARNLGALPSVDLLITAKAARDVDGLAAGLLRDLTREAVAAAYRAVRDNADDLITYGLRPVWDDALTQLESIAARISPLVVDEVTALRAGSDTATAWLDATAHADRYWSTLRSRASLSRVAGTESRDPEGLTLLGRRVDQRAKRAEPAHRVAVALHRARTRTAADAWMPTTAEYVAALDAKATA
jgi:hypothetical protein